MGHQRLHRGGDGIFQEVVDHADDVANLTWAGQSYENSAVRPTGRVVEERIQLSEGFDIRSTEAVLLDFVTL